MGGPVKDMKGVRVGYLTVIDQSHLPPNSSGEVKWLCVCDCGKEVHRTGAYLRRPDKNNQSCGCQIGKDKVIHGMDGTKIYYIWSGMKKRCYNKNASNYHLYGGRGIRVCNRWKNSFVAFFEDFGHNYKEGLSIDRIDNDGDYEPGNVKWATAKEQANNRRDNNIISTNRGAMTIAQAARSYGIGEQVIRDRKRRGWPEEDCTLPVNGKHKLRR